MCELEIKLASALGVLLSGSHAHHQADCIHVFQCCAAFKRSLKDCFEYL